MSKSVAADVIIGASTSDVDLLDYVLAISSGITPTALMKAIGRLPAGTNSGKIGALCIGASMNIRRVINDLRSKTAINLPEEWMINNEINFTMFAMAGHLIFMLPDDDLTDLGKAAKKVYQGTIGGVSDISMFNQSTEIPGKEDRSKILLRWSSQLGKFNISSYQSTLAAKFPKLVKDKRGIVGAMLGRIYSLVTSPFHLALAVLSKAFSLLILLVFYVLIVAAAYFVLDLVVKYAATNVSVKIASNAQIAFVAPTDAFGTDAIVGAASETGAFLVRVVTALPMIAYSVLTSTAGLPLKTLSLGPKSFVLIRDAVDTKGESIKDYVEGQGLRRDISATVEYITSLEAPLLSNLIEITTGEVPKNPDSLSFASLLEGVADILIPTPITEPGGNDAKDSGQDNSAMLQDEEEDDMGEGPTSSINSGVEELNDSSAGDAPDYFEDKEEVYGEF